LPTNRRGTESLPAGRLIYGCFVAKLLGVLRDDIP
jgi:hypothetical protein